MLLAFALVAGVVTGSAQGALVNRGGGMIYDTELKMTWLEDANYAKTSGFSSTGEFATWSDAVSWASNLVYGGYDDWRLPTVSPTNGSAFNINYSYKGDTDTGYNIAGTNSQYGNLFYKSLSLMGNISVEGQAQAAYGVSGLGSQTYYGETTTVGPFQNIVSGMYWTGTSAPSSLINPNFDNYAFSFDFRIGSQNGSYKNSAEFAFMRSFAWAVRDGDVASSIPEPGSVTLLGLALAGLTAFRTKRLVSKRCVSLLAGRPKIRPASR